MGNFGIVLTRRYLLYIVLVITCGLAIYVFILTDIEHSHEVRPISKLTWDQFRKDCGYNAYLENQQRALAKFDRIYYN